MYYRANRSADFNKLAGNGPSGMSVALRRDVPLDSGFRRDDGFRTRLFPGGPRVDKSNVSVLIYSISFRYGLIA